MFCFCVVGILEQAKNLNKIRLSSREQSYRTNSIQLTESNWFSS